MADTVNNFEKELEQNFESAKNEIEHEKTLKELEDKGILAVFLQRKKNNIFRENPLTSEQATNYAKIARDAYAEIQKAAFYDLSNPKEAQKWLNNLTPYLNDSTLALENYTHFGVPSVPNPVDDLINSLDQKGYDKLITPVVGDLAANHNKIVNAKNAIRALNPTQNDFEDKLSQQLQIIETYIDDRNITSVIRSTKDFENINDRLKKYNEMIYKKGAINTILEILDEYNYDHKSDRNSGNSLEEITAHDFINLEYGEIKEYGFLLEPLKKQIDEKEQQLQTIIESSEIQNYIEKMHTRLQESFSEDNNELTEEDLMNLTKKSNPLSNAFKAFTDKFINTTSKSREGIELTAEEQKIKEKVDSLENMSIDSFAYELRDLSKYINNPDKPLMLSDGTNVAKKILDKAAEIGYLEKNTAQIIEENKNANPVLINYSSNQINELVKFGCFITTKCVEVMEEKHIDFENQADEPIIKSENKIDSKVENKDVLANATNRLDTYQTNIILDLLVEKNNDILLKKGESIDDLHGEIEKLNDRLNDLEKDNSHSTLNGSLELIETITESAAKQNVSFEEYLKNMESQKEQEIVSLNMDRQKMLQQKNEAKNRILSTYINDYKLHVSNQEKLKNTDPVALQKEIDCAKSYQLIRSYIEEIEKVGRIDFHNLAELDIIKQGNENRKQESLVLEIKNIIDTMQKNTSLSNNEVNNLNELTNLMQLQTQIDSKSTEIAKNMVELVELRSYGKHDSKNEEIEKIKKKLLQLNEEEAMLSFNPDTLKNEINMMMQNNASKEEISAKIDELINPIISYNKEDAKKLAEEIVTLEAKVANNENYIDDEKVALATEKKDILSEQLEHKKQELEKMTSSNQNSEELKLLDNQKNVLLNQQQSYEEEAQILREWDVEEANSNQETRDALSELMDDSKHNLSSIKEEISLCEEKTSIINNQRTEKINKMNEELSDLEKQVADITSSIEDKKNSKYINKELKLSDIEKLNNMKQKLLTMQPQYYEKIKEDILNQYDKQLQGLNNKTIELPGALADGKEIKSNGEIIDKPLPLPGVTADDKVIRSDGTKVDDSMSLPGVLENGNTLNSDWTIESITDSNETLLQKANKKFKNIGKTVLDWIKKHPKIATAIGVAVTAVTVGATIIIKSLSGDTVAEYDANSMQPKESSTQIENEVEMNTESNEITDAVDEAINQIEEEKQTDNFQTAYDNAINDIVDGKTKVYTSADRAIEGKDAVDNIYVNSFENANLNRIYKLEDGKLSKVSFDEAQQIVENGGKVSAAVENNGTGIGYIAIDGNQLSQVSENTEGISK